jgi:hypothetical protein
LYSWPQTKNFKPLKLIFYFWQDGRRRKRIREKEEEEEFG